MAPEIRTKLNELIRDPFQQVVYAATDQVVDIPLEDILSIVDAVYGDVNQKSNAPIPRGNLNLKAATQ